MVKGQIWFLLPVMCVVMNDIWAYIVGKLFGRTRLLALSPKKTVEGFLGAFVMTVVWAFWFSGFLGHFPEMYCPAASGFRNADNIPCERHPIFVQEEIAFPHWIQQLSGHQLTSFLCSSAQKHALVLGTFASLVAPFGGFFASGLKRAFKLKDFSSLIPGHGGMTDRMDCQGIMGVCTYFYLRTYVFKHSASVLGCLSSISFPELTAHVLELDDERRRLLLVNLQESLLPQ